MVHFAVIFREKFLNDKDCLSDLLVYLSHFIHLHSSSSLAIYYAQITSQKEYLLKSMNLSYVNFICLSTITDSCAMEFYCLILHFILLPLISSKKSTNRYSWQRNWILTHWASETMSCMVKYFYENKSVCDRSCLHCYSKKKKLRAHTFIILMTSKS